MACYENVFIVRQDVSAQQVEDLTTRFTGIVSQGGGTVTKNEYWGLRTLAYKIKKNRKGHYVLLNVDAPSDAVKEMERNMNLNEDVMRFLTIRVDELEEGPSVMMRSRAGRDDRDRDRGRPRDGGRDRGRPRDSDRPSATAAAAPDKKTDAADTKTNAADKKADDSDKKASAADTKTDAADKKADDSDKKTDSKTPDDGGKE